MIRVSLILFAIACVAVAALALMGDAGHASLEWLGWSVSTTAAVAALLTLFTALLATIFWNLVLWIARAPRRRARALADQRHKQGMEALSRGFLAAAEGDGSEARRMAQRAADLSPDAPALVRLLTAQAAETAGDIPAARAAYTAMLDYPDMRLAAQRGLMQTALVQNDRTAALAHAEEAWSSAKTARWAWRALLEDRLSSGDWAAALDLVKTALNRKIVSPIVAERARAALLAASAANLEATQPQQALDFAGQSAKLKAGFVPGAVIAARLLAAEGKAPRAFTLLEQAWRETPHPALWLAYRDLKTAETPRERAQRLAALAAQNPSAREARILAVEAALISGDREAAAQAAAALADEPVTQRLAGLNARLAYGAGDADAARVWMARGAAAAQEPEWSDIDPSGKAFAYSPADWARLVSTYAETGELIHPRFERRDPVITELPRAPMAYEAADRFVNAAESGLGHMPVTDDGFYADAFDDHAGPDDVSPPPAPAQRRAAPRRRLATPRASK
jgi:HemY protein